MAMISNGNIGIGTTTPAYTLDVNGQARLGAWYFNTTSHATAPYSMGTNSSLSYSNMALYQVPTLTVLNNPVAVDLRISNTNRLSITNTAITLNSPITPAYTYPIASGNIGQLITGTFVPVNGSAYSSSYLTLSSITITAGTWIVSTFSITFISNATNITYVESGLFTATQTYALFQNRYPSNISSTNSISIPLCSIINVSGSTVVSHKVLIYFTGTAPTCSNFEYRLQAVRIA
jgi:hypothetical protein